MSDATITTAEKPEYYCRLTAAGSALEAAAHAAGKTVRLTAVAVGDGGGSVPAPDEAATALVHEVCRRSIDSREQDSETPAICWLHVIFPADVGGWWIREFGVYADPLEEDGAPVLYAVGNHAPYFKVKSVFGQAVTHELAIPLTLTGAAEVEIVVNDAGYATRTDLLQLRARVAELSREAETLRAELDRRGTGWRLHISRQLTRIAYTNVLQSRHIWRLYNHLGLETAGGTPLPNGVSAVEGFAADADGSATSADNIVFRADSGSYAAPLSALTLQHA